MTTDIVPFDFGRQHGIGQRYEQVLDKFFGQHYFVQPATREQQRLGIDRLFVEEEEDGWITVEYKTDLRAGQTGNAFIETISVDTRNVLGWAYTCTADAIAYFVPDIGICLLVDTELLRSRLDGWKRMYPARKVQNSDYCTHGILVPFKALVNEAFEVFHV